MKRSAILIFSGPLVALGAALAVACLTSTWYINRLQADLARTVRNDVTRLRAAEELQIELRHLRFHSVVFAADPTGVRRAEAAKDRGGLLSALATARHECDAKDSALLDEIEAGFQRYLLGLGIEGADTPPVQSLADLVLWSDQRHVSGLLVPCRELAERQRIRMNDNLQRSEIQTHYAGQILVALGVIGSLSGLLSGYATARRLTRRTAQLSVRIQAVKAHLNQEVGAMTVESPGHFGDVDAELDLIVNRVRDVCQRLQEQERELLRAEQLAAVGQLAAGVAHEIRNPLTGIKLLVEAALRPIRPSPLTPVDLGMIREEILRLERTVHGLLDFARTPPLKRQCHDLRAVIAESIAVLKSRAEAQSVAIRFESPPKPLLADVDRDQLLSLLTNLLLNATEAAPPGGTVSIESSKLPSGMIEIAVTDKGSGIDSNILDKLFTPFATTKSNGTGLGLAIARRVARDHGGDLTATNRPEGGAKFTVSIPTEGVNDAEIDGRG